MPSALVPDMPTVASVLPGYELMQNQGMFAPATTPRSVVDFLSAEIAKMQSARDFRDMYDKQALEPFVSTPEQLAEMLRVETAKLTKLVKTEGIKF